MTSAADIAVLGSPPSLVAFFVLPLRQRQLQHSRARGEEVRNAVFEPRAKSAGVFEET